MGIEETSDKVLRYRIEVMALAAADVVVSLGGLLFDRRCLGWDTLVLLDDCTDIRPLQIIGADFVELQATLDMPGRQPTAVATSIELYRSDPRVRLRVDGAIDSRSSEVLLWGEIDSIGAQPHMISVAHRVSRAAATFKTHALTGTGAAVKTSADLVVEKFLVTRATWQPARTQGRSTPVPDEMAQTMPL
jgi:hypothetical protein